MTKKKTTIIIGTTMLVLSHNIIKSVLKKYYSQKIYDRYFLWNSLAGTFNFGIWMIISISLKSVINPSVVPYYIGVNTVSCMWFECYIQMLKMKLKEKDEESMSQSIKSNNKGWQ